MKQYLELMNDILHNGSPKADRTGTGTLSVFGRQMRFDLSEGFPLVTTKKVHLRAIIHELLWFLKGDTNIKYLKDNNVSIWDEWAVTEEQSNRWENLDWLGILDASLYCPPSFEGWSWEDIKTWFISAELNPEDYKIEKPGDLGPVYSKQWRDWVGPDGRHHDQISNVIEQLRNDPDSRRIIVSAWNVGELDQMALAPCHSFFQFYTRELTGKERVRWLRNNDERRYQVYNHTLEDIDEDEFFDEAGVPARQLSCQLYQRSGDFFLGIPFNIASYALLIHMVAQQVNMLPGEFVHTFGDAHIYSNHLEQVKLQLTREPSTLPKLNIKRKPGSIFDYQFDDFEIVDYHPHPAIKAPVAI